MCNREKKGPEGSLYTTYIHINLKITVPYHEPFGSFTFALLKISISCLTFQHLLSFAAIFKAILHFLCTALTLLAATDLKSDLVF